MTSLSLGLFLAFFSALTTAANHAFLKAGEDKLAVRTWGSLICAFVALPIVIWSGPLPRDLWRLMGAFALISAVNQLILIRSYQVSDFSAAYPVARGVVPVAMALLGVIVLGDQLSMLSALGVGIITTGIVAMAIGKGMTRQGWTLAIFTGLTTVGYNILAAKGMRVSSDPVNFLAWIYVTDGILIPAYLLATTKAGTPIRLRQSFASSWQVGVVTLFSFSAFALAMRFAPVGPVSAIRESSVLIGLVLAAFMLKEQLDRWRIGAGLLIVAGAVMLVFG